ncbi:MAG TPA: septal ring lytic transglycosylase RlpA family protein [Candidatus Eisenbacteria bacterium]|nr:septal ring lytic transglycosylase RlpA family protein [Candidatus Eisenbacteria bacterium]
MVPAPTPMTRAMGAIQVGIASFYHSSLVGNLTANGERYDEGALTAAHRTLGLGTRVRVTNLENRRSVVVTVNDRGPYAKGRIIDLSRRAARVLGFVHDGVTKVKVEPLT